MPLRLVVAACLLLGTLGCDRDARREGDEDGPVTLTYWTSQNPQERALARELVDAWNAEHADVQVKIQPLPAGQSSEEVLLAAIVAGTTPDLCSNIWPGIVGDFVRADGVVALDTMPGFDALVQQRLPDGVIDRFRAPDGHVYQIPWKTNPIMMLYNRRLFREVGIDEPPRTYSEYFEAAERVTADLDGDGYLDRWMGYREIRPMWYERYFDFYPFYIAASGGQTLFEDGEVDIDTAAAITAFSFFRDAYARHYFPVTVFQGSAMLQEKVATEFTGPWSISWMEDNAPDFENHYAPLPVPDGHEGPAYTYGDFKNIAVFASTEHPEAAWRFARYLVTREADLRLLEVTRQIPVRRDLLADTLYADFFARNPKVVPFARQAPYTRGVDAVASLTEVLDAVAQQYEAAAVYRVRTPEEATRQAIERIRLIHEWSL